MLRVAFAVILVLGSALLVFAGLDPLHRGDAATALLSPGPLGAAHAALADARACDACHENFAGPSEARCLGCHPSVADARAKEAGYHGRLAGACTDCHVEHRGEQGTLTVFDERSFNHQLAAFPLLGRHQAAECPACHVRARAADGDETRGQWHGLEHARCATCHEGHAGKLGTACEDCHTENGFTGRFVTFDHAKRFVLEGAHAGLACRACHRDMASDPKGSSPFTPIGTRCTACHAPAHGLSAEGACDRCHDATSWKTDRRPFDHGRSRFPLEGAHLRVACDRCHAKDAMGGFTDTPFTAAKSRCAECHEPAHGLGRESACDRCHDATSWTLDRRPFDHSKAAFVLEGAHLRIDCARCHPKDGKDRFAGTEFGSAAKECRSCHGAAHGGGAKADACGSCHGVTSFAVTMSRPAHATTGFPLDGRHAEVACEGCHARDPSGSFRGTDFGAAPGRCAECHRDPHAPTLGDDCGRCHDLRDFRAAARSFDHARTAFPLDALHRGVACAACHERGRYRDLPTRCESCHADAEDLLFGRGPHADLGEDPHAAKTKCEQCHDRASGDESPSAHAARCARCHTPRYAELYLDHVRARDLLLASPRPDRPSPPRSAPGHNPAALRRPPH